MTRSMLLTSLLASALAFAACPSTPSVAENEQRVVVTIKDFTFVAQSAPLLPGLPIMVTVSNHDEVRHDFGSVLLQGGPTEVEGNGVIAYGRGVEGVYLNPGQTAKIRIVSDRPGRYEFRCSIHPKMRGELLLLNVGAA